MRILFYTYSYFFDASLCFIRSMSKKAEMHVIMEVTPEEHRTPLFDIDLDTIEKGLIDADNILKESLPEGMEQYWSNVNSFKFSVYDNRNPIHPDTFNHGAKIGQWINKIHPDLILFDDISLRIAIGSLYFRNIPWVIGVHDPELHSGERDWRRPISKLLMYKRARLFILHNQAQEKLFMGKNNVAPERSTVIHLGIYDVYKNWTNEQKAEDKHVLFFGRFTKYKGIDTLLDAAALVCKEINNVTFDIVGGEFPGYRLPELPLLPHGGKINIVKKYVSPYELAGYFRKTHCVVCPYIDATQSGVVLTAYAFQKPVIATNVGGLPEYVFHEKTGLLVNPKDPKMLADAIMRVLEEKELQHKLRKGISGEQLLILDWDEIANRYLEMFKNAIG